MLSSMSDRTAYGIQGILLSMEFIFSEGLISIAYQGCSETYSMLP
jgi:hypothetical protein